MQFIFFRSDWVINKILDTHFSFLPTAQLILKFMNYEKDCLFFYQNFFLNSRTSFLEKHPNIFIFLNYFLFKKNYSIYPYQLNFDIVHSVKLQWTRK